MEKLPLTTQTLYAELLQKCMAVPGPTGSLFERDINGGRYLYLKATVGSVREDVHVGRVGLEHTTELMRKRILAANATLKPRRQLVRMLKIAGLRGPPSAVAHIMGAMKWHGILNSAVVVGTVAFGCYPALVGHAFDDAMMGTEDVDIATLDLALAADRADISLLNVLQKADASFAPLPSLSKSAPPSRFRSDEGFIVDMLTQTRKRSASGQVPLPNLAAGAQSMQHMAWLIDTPAKAVLLSGAGILVDVPQPARFALHKLIVAQKRTQVDRLKRQKDLTQARTLIEALKKSDPESLLESFEDACQQGKSGWEEPIKKSLRELALDLG